MRNGETSENVRFAGDCDRPSTLSCAKCKQAALILRSVGKAGVQLRRESTNITLQALLGASSRSSAQLSSESTLHHGLGFSRLAGEEMFKRCPENISDMIRELRVIN